MSSAPKPLRPELNDLLLRAKSGDAAALNELLEALRPLLRQWAERLLDPRLRIRLDPSDLTQDSLMEFFHRFAKFQGNTTQEMLAYLRKILARNHIDKLRSQVDAIQRSVGTEVSLNGDAGDENLLARLQALITSPSQQVARKEQVEQILQAMRSLPNTQREALMLHIEGYSHIEIAQELGKTESAAQSLVKHALQTLRQQFPRELSNGSAE